MLVLQAENTIYMYSDILNYRIAPNGKDIVANDHILTH